MHEYARVQQLPISDHSTAVKSYRAITDSNRGWPLLGLLTLPTAGEREQVGVWNDTQSKQNVYAHVCMF